MAFAGTQVANSRPASAIQPDTEVILYIALSFGFSLAVNAWIFFRVTGGLFNPAVTLGLVLIGAVPAIRGVLVFFAQMLGAMTAAGVISALYPGPLLVTTQLGGGANKAQGLFIEMFLTAQLVFTIFMLAAEKHKGTFLAPVGIGLSLFIAELSGVYYTGGSLNPARSFGPCIANASFPDEHWIYWVGPILGALLASAFFWFIKSCEYETVNPGQDFDDLEAQVYDPEVDLTRPVVSPTAVADPTGSVGEGTERMNRILSGEQPQRPQQSQQADRASTGSSTAAASSNHRLLTETTNNKATT